MLIFKKMTTLKKESPIFVEKNNILEYTNLKEMKKLKKIRDCSASSSNKIISNLSNPTNLTNPLIICKPRKYNQNDSQESILSSSKEYKINKLNEYNKLLFKIDNMKIQTSKSELNLLKEGIDILNPIASMNKSIQKTLKPLKPISIKKPFKIIEYRNLRQNINYEPKICNCNMSEGKYKNGNSNETPQDFNSYDNIKDINNIEDKDKGLNPIWARLQNSKSLKPSEKDIRINITKKIQKYDYIDKKNKIQFLRYDFQVKNNRYQKIKRFTKNEIKSIDNMMDNLAKSSDYIQNSYQEKYVANILFLSRQIEKEKIETNNILNEKNLLLKQIFHLKYKIIKMKEERENILNWIYLQIKAKENKKNLPLYYKDIIENKMSLDSLIKKYKWKRNANIENEYNKIKQYKDKLIYDNIEEILEIIHIFEKKAFDNLNKKMNNINMVNELKRDLNINTNNKSKKTSEENEDNKNKNKKDIISLEEKQKELNLLLRKVKFKNNILNEEYLKIAHYKNIMNNDNHINSFYNVYSDRNINLKHDDYDSRSSRITSKNEITESNSLFTKILNLYKIISKVGIDNIKNDIRIKITYSEEKIILDILKHTDKLIDFLYEEKKNYFSDEKSKMKYKLIENKIDKETKNKKLLKQLELQDQRLLNKKEKTLMKMNKKNYYKPYRKIDFEYYRSQLNSKNNNKKDIKIDKENLSQYFFY